MRIFEYVLLLSFVIFMMSSSQKVESTPTSDPVIEFRKQYVNKQYNEHGFICSNNGGGGDGKRYRHLNIGFNTRESLTIISARRYLVEAVTSFMNQINSIPNMQNEFTEWPFNVNMLNYTLRVMTGNGVWPLFPNGQTPDNKISYVTMSHGKIRYLIGIEPLKMPVKIHSETFDEAIAILKAEGWTEPKN